MGFDKKVYQRDLMRKRRAKKHAEAMGQEQPLEGDLLPDGRKKYPGREYREDGSVVLHQYKCPEEECGGVWGASIQTVCPYCGGSGKRRYA